jgi:hypothetical protein
MKISSRQISLPEFMAVRPRTATRRTPPIAFHGKDSRKCALKRSEKVKWVRLELKIVTKLYREMTKLVRGRRCDPRRGRCS